MFEKSGKFFADWRDEDQRRRRKSFKTPRAAMLYETQMRERSSKRRAQGQRWPKSCADTSSGQHTKTVTRSTKPQKRSSTSRGNCVPINSRQRKQSRPRTR
jgi:hypothetical protein